MTWLRSVVAKGLCWNVADGRKVSFWDDSWLMGGRLAEVALDVVDPIFRTTKVADMWDANIGWNRGVFGAILPPTSLLRLLAGPLCSVSGDHDSVRWGGTTSGFYSVASIYRLNIGGGTISVDMKLLYKEVWHIHVHERIQMFLWLVVKGRVLTNTERCRRHIVVDDLRAIFGGAREDLIHLLRDCPKIKQVWLSMVTLPDLPDFFIDDITV